MIQWRDISRILPKVCKASESYLSTAFDHTENLWTDQFERFNKRHPIKLIILSEAPQYGKGETYIYNLKARATSFFNYKLVSEAFNCPEPAKRDLYERKKWMLDKLYKNGVLIVDVFPFAFNDKDTPKCTYKGFDDKEYGALFAASCEYYFRQKLKLINSVIKMYSRKPACVFRYKRVMDAVGDRIQDELKIYGNGIYIDDVRSIHGNGRLASYRKLKDIVERLNS